MVCTRGIYIYIYTYTRQSATLPAKRVLTFISTGASRNDDQSDPTLSFRAESIILRLWISGPSCFTPK